MEIKERQYEVATIMHNRDTEVHVVLLDGPIGNKEPLQDFFQLYLQEIANEQGYIGPVGIATLNAERTEIKYKAPASLEDFFNLDPVTLPESILRSISGNISVNINELASLH